MHLIFMKFADFFWSFFFTWSCTIAKYLADLTYQDKQERDMKKGEGSENN